MTQRIEILPEHVINQIKAGEVIDSPSGILKELFENSIDSGADKISINIIENGLNKITIEDNGSGISFEDLPLAFARHATSKIKSFKDLYSLNSFGFRGEALASLASVAEVNCTSTTIDETSRYQIKGDQVLLHEQIEQKRIHTGTSLSISNLFYNTPVRLKFLSSEQKEKRQILKLMKSLFIINPDIEFHYSLDNKEKKIFLKSTPLKRIAQVLNSKVENIMEVKNSFEDISLDLYISQQSSSRPTQIIFINNRLVEDSKIKNTINYSILNLYNESKRNWVLKLEMPGHKLDVNVHPKKTKVKLHQDNLIYSLISKTIKSAYQPISNQTIDIEPQKIEGRPVYQNSNFHNQEKQNFHPTHTNQVIDHSNSTLNSYRVINKDFSKNTYYLIDKDEEFFKLRKDDLAEYCLAKLAESQPIPLLISEPCTIEDQESLQILKNLKIDFTQISDDQVLINNIPEILSYYNFNRINSFSSSKDLLASLSLKQDSAAHFINKEDSIEKYFINLENL